MDDCIEILREKLKRHEGFRGFPYLDTVRKMTIGYGRNLDDNGISEKEATLLLENDIKNIIEVPKKYIRVYEELSPLRKAVILNMLFNMGESRFSKFLRMIAAINAKNFDGAADEMLNSAWARQVGNRATELAKDMKNG